MSSCLGLFRERVTLAFLLLLLLSLLLQVGMGLGKRGFHVDEGFSCLLASVGLDRFHALIQSPPPREFVGHDLLRFYDLQPKAHGKYRKIIRKTAHDVHPPVYYLLLHEILAWSGGRLNAWQGMGLNMVAHAVSMVLLHLLARRLWPGQPVAALFPVALWGLSLACLNQVLFIRMYALLTLEALVLAVLWFKLQDRDRPSAAVAAGWVAVVLLGALTHYYFIVWAVLLAGAGLVGLRSNVRRILVLSLGTAVGLVGAQALFPAMRDHMLGSYRSQEIQDKAWEMGSGQWELVVRKVRDFATLFADQMSLWAGMVLVLGVGALAVRVACRRPDPLAGLDRDHVRGWAVFGWAVAGYAGFAVVLSPYTDLRFLAPVLPLLALPAVGLGVLVPRGWMRPAALAALVLLCLVQVRPERLDKAFHQPERPFTRPEKTGLIFIREPVLGWNLWNAPGILLPEQRYLLVYEHDLLPGGVVPAELERRPDLLQGLRVGRPDFLLLELP